MENAVRSLAGKVRWKLKMLLLSRRSCRLLPAVQQQVLSNIEYRSPAIYYAKTIVLIQLVQLQDHFLGELAISREAALMDFSLAPLSMRRDLGRYIVLLGLLRHATIGDKLENLNASLLMQRSVWGLVSKYAGAANICFSRSC
jgi:hypothetical protein